MGRGKKNSFGNVDINAMNITEYFKEKSTLIQQRLNQLVEEKNTPHAQLFKAARYSLLNGGKRLRPILTLATAETLGQPAEKALSAACALEMIHTYSLIHDDLPCMDDDDFRRGQPTLHKAYGEGHAVLAGDYLLTYAFEVIAKETALNADQKLSLISTLAKNAGSEGMIGGQLMDIEAESKPIDLKFLNLIHRHKTGALITAAIEFGAIIANASSQHQQLLHSFGNDLGLAFQIVDDILDITASEQKHGKKIASDAINQKTTYATLLGIEKAEQHAAELLTQAKNHLNRLPFNCSLLHSIAERLVHRSV